MHLKHVLATLFLTAALPLFSQVVPSATRGGGGIGALVVGAGFSDYDVDWGHGRMEGGALWIDWSPNMGPSFLHGLGIEAEARDISLGRSSTQPSNFRQDTGGGGVIYHWHHYRNFHPYGKFLISLGSFDFRNGVPNAPNYNHDTRNVYAPGGGLEYRIIRNIWVRADYEYQYWPHLFKPNNVVNPQGFTVGASYDLSHIHVH